jgi:HK97 family phage portal protein
MIRTLRRNLLNWLMATEQRAGGLRLTPFQSESVLRPNWQSLVDEGYQKNAVVFSCIAALAMDYPEPPMRIYADDRTDAPSLPNHPLRKLIMRPNPLMGERELWMYTMCYGAIGGNSYWHIVRDKRGLPRELWPYHYGQIQPIPESDPDQPWVTLFQFDDGTGPKKVIPAADIVHFKWPSPDPKQPWQSQPPLQAVAAPVDTDNELDRYLRALIQNDLVPRTVMIVPEGGYVDDEQAKRMQRRFSERHGGDRRGGIAILEAGVELKRIGLDLRELAFDALHRVPERRIASAFRVPLSVAGIGDDPTYSNSEEAYKRYVQSTLAPMWALWGDEVQNALGDAFGVVTRHDLSAVRALREDATAMWGRVIQAHTAQLVTKNEARAMIGLPPTAGGDAFAPEPMALPAPKPDPEPEPTPEPPKRREVRSEPNPRITRLERALNREVASTLAQFYAEAAASVSEKADVSGREAKNFEQLALDLGASLGFLLRRFYLAVLPIAFDDGAQTLVALGSAAAVDLTFDLANEFVQDVLGEVATLVKGITDTTREELQTLVGRQAAEGWSTGRLAEAISELSGLHSRTRAEMIATTEAARAASAGTVIAFQVSGEVSGMEWLTTDGPCPICDALNGKRVALGKSFGGGIPYPPAHPRCRCVVLPVLTGEAL